MEPVKELYSSIRFVALYLRKSRGEEDIDLEKHRMLLTDLAKQHNWKYIEYREVASADNIQFRPEFQKLLRDLENGLFDAVAVVDYDRLGRGDMLDQAFIKKAFRESGTIIVTPSKFYNLNNESDEFQSDVEGLFARQEYKRIIKRLQRGKKMGARLGNWTNGKPSFPYKYNPATKGLIVNEEVREVYLEMKFMALDGIPCYQICWEFNKRGVKSPSGGLWHENTVRRILLDETHLGHIISNKTQGGLHKNKKANPYIVNPREEWIVVENCHEVLKTKEEHEKILALFAKRKVIPLAARKGKYILSGLVYCGKCGYSLQFLTKQNGNVLVKKCQKTDPFGNRCDNRGMNVSYILEAIAVELEQYEQSLLHVMEKRSNSEEIRMERLLEAKEKELEKAKKALDRVREMYEEGDYVKEEYQERKTKREKEIGTITKEIDELKQILDYNKKVTTEEKFARIQRFRELWDSEADSAVKNKIAGELIDKIRYVRERNSNEVNIEIQFR